MRRTVLSGSLFLAVALVHRRARCLPNKATELRLLPMKSAGSYWARLISLKGLSSQKVKLTKAVLRGGPLYFVLQLGGPGWGYRHLAHASACSIACKHPSSSVPELVHGQDRLLLA
jgi:hypothetical protein